MPTDLMIVGAGGHAKVVIEALFDGGADFRILAGDQDRHRHGDVLIGRVPVVHLGEWREAPSRIHIAIGDNEIRQTLYREALQSDKELVSIIHPGARVSSYCVIGAGSFVAAAALVAVEAELGVACIVNHAAVVDHDCRIGGFTHIGPNATLGGGVQVGRGCLIGAGATLLAGVRVGDNAVIGAGSVVIADIKDGQTVVGVPAKHVKG